MIPLPFSFQDPQKAANFNWIAITIGVAVILFFNMWILGLCLIGFSAFNLYRMKGNQNNPGNNNQFDKDGFV